MKIAFIGGRDIDSIGGIENYMANLAANLVKQGHTPILYCESNHSRVECHDGIQVVHFRSFGGRYFCKILLSLRSTLHALFCQKDVQIFHYNAWPPSLWSWIPRLFGRKVILQSHGAEWQRTKYSAFGRAINHFMEWLTAKFHKNILVVSAEQHDYFLQHYKLKTTIITSAVNLPTQKPQSDILTRFNLQNEKYFLFVGRLVQEKNPDILIKAFCEAKFNDDYKLVIAGNNPQHPKYIQYLHSIANKDVIFTDAVYGEDKNMLLSSCFAFCLPSSIEGFPISLLEAMSYKRLCIVSNIESMHEVLGDCGIYVAKENIIQLKDALISITTTRLDTKTISEDEYNRIKNNFTWDKITSQYINYLNSIL